MALTSGARLGPYEILAPLGQGGMGEVYRARDTKLDRDVAVKVLPPHLADNPAALARFDPGADLIPRRPAPPRPCRLFLVQGTPWEGLTESYL